MLNLEKDDVKRPIVEKILQNFDKTLFEQLATKENITTFNKTYANIKKQIYKIYLNPLIFSQYYKLKYFDDECNRDPDCGDINKKCSYKSTGNKCVYKQGLEPTSNNESKGLFGRIFNTSNECDKKNPCAKNERCEQNSFTGNKCVEIPSYQQQQIDFEKENRKMREKRDNEDRKLQYQKLENERKLQNRKLDYENKRSEQKDNSKEIEKYGKNLNNVEQQQSDLEKKIRENRDYYKDMDRPNETMMIDHVKNVIDYENVIYTRDDYVIYHVIMIDHENVIDHETIMIYHKTNVIYHVNAENVIDHEENVIYHENVIYDEII